MSETKNPTIALIQEPPTPNKFVQYPTNCTPFETKSKPRTAIFCPKPLNFTLISALSHKQATTIQGKLNGQSIIIASIYCTGKTLPTWIEDIIKYADEKKLGLILAGDFNAHSNLWGDNTVETSNKGKEVEELIFTHNMKLHNNDKNPTFRNSRDHISWIDLTLSKGLKSDIQDWRVIDHVMNYSDHNTIEFSLKNNNIYIPSHRPWYKANWSLLVDILASHQFKLEEQTSQATLDTQVEKLYECINNALNKACPMTKPKYITPTYNSWYTKQHKQLRHRVSKLYTRFKNIADDSPQKAIAKLDYKKLQKTYNKACTTARKDAERKYIKHISSITEASQLYKKSTNFSQVSIGTLIDKQGKETTPGRDTLRALFDTHFPRHTAKTLPNPDKKVIPTADIHKSLNNLITIDKVKKALQTFDSKKSPGPDNLKPIIFKHFPPNILKHILFIYKASIKLSYTPLLLIETKVTFIQKPGKDKYNIPKNFRPISLSNYLLKGLERIMGWHMKIQLQKYPIHNNQHGFRNDKSTESAISNTADLIERNILNRKHCIGVSLDIQAAFDSISPMAIKNALLKHGCHPDFAQWYFVYLTHRNLNAELHGETYTATTGIGFPQGGVVSADFWKIVFDPAVCIVNEKKTITGFVYADDVIIARAGYNPEASMKDIQHTINKLIKWGKTCNLEFNPEKTVVVIFNKQKIHPNNYPTKLNIGGKAVPFSDTMRYLGVTLDSKLEWDIHRNNIIRTAKQNLMALSKIISAPWGPRPILSRWMYTGIIRPKLTYAALAWGHTLNTSKVKKQLEHLNRIALLAITPIRKSIATKSLEIIYNVWPLDLFISYTGLATHRRLYPLLTLSWTGTNKSGKKIGHLKHWETLKNNFDITYPATDKINSLVWNKKFKINSDSFGPQYDTMLTHTQINVYTDGSKTAKGVGAGSAIYLFNQLIHEDFFPLAPGATIFQAELIAIANAAKQISKFKKIKPKYVKFFSDSRAALMALDSHKITSKTTHDTITALNKLGRATKRLSLNWIKAHKGHQGNEIADRLANQAANTGQEFQMVLISDNLIKQYIKDKIYDHWFQDWQSNTTQFKHTKKFFPYMNEKTSKQLLKLDRQQLTQIIHATTGHNNLRYHSNKINPLTHTHCRLCKDRKTQETFVHLFFDCSALQVLRYEVHKKYKPYNRNNRYWSLNMIIDFIENPQISLLLKNHPPQ